MAQRRRFIFHGNASAAGGWITRPDTKVLDVNCGASSLQVTGGISRADLKQQNFVEGLSFTSATTLAQGVFDDLKQADALTRREVREEDLTTTTTVSAEVQGLVVGVKPHPVLTVKLLRAASGSKSSNGSGETRIKLMDETDIQGVDVSGHALVVKLNKSPFQEHDTRSKLLAAADHEPFMREHGACFFMNADAAQPGSPRSRQLVESRGEIYATIVRELRWGGKEYPGSKIEANSVFIPDFGTIFFGELIIGDGSRRLTMMRLELGSPLSGQVAMSAVDHNGSWSP